MSIIQKIQDQYGKVMAVIIGLSLVIFIVMLAFENGGSLFHSSRDTVGKVNGESVDLKEFDALVKQQSDMMSQRNMGSGEMLSQQANETAWNQEVAKILIQQESGKLGLAVGKKEFNDLILGNNPSPFIKQYFTNPQTGEYDAAMAQQVLKNLQKEGKQEQQDQINPILTGVVFNQLAEKYNALLTNSINFPKWMIEKQNQESALLSKVSFVKQPYTSISDSAVKVTDAEIQDYIGKHKDDFKQKESRSIEYVAFSAQPSAQDSAAARARVLALKPGFDSTKNIKAYLAAQGAQNFYDSYLKADQINIPVKDSLFKMGVGAVYGPYVDGTNYSLSRLLGSRTSPDTVKVRHILVATAQPDRQSGQLIPVRDSVSAKKSIDSIELAIRNGKNFDSLVKLSDDQGSVASNGIIDNITNGQMMPEFNDFIFGNGTGAKGIVKTGYGYHYIEILSQKGSSPVYKVATISKPIEASSETDMAANNAATQFVAHVTDQKSFAAEAEKLAKQKGINKAVAADIPPSGAMIQGLGASRAFVRSIYKAGAGDVLQPERVGDFYVVGLVTEVNADGTASLAKARGMVEPLLINKKKAEIITKKIGKISTLEAAATAMQQPVQVADSLRFDGQSSQALGFEPKVIGAAFNKANLNKVVPEPIAGTQGVYVVRVDNQMATPVMKGNADQERAMRYMQAKQRANFSFLQALQDAADIKDKRSEIY